ncbi:amino acid ABC transporter permease [Enterococcus sp. OL5]|uniref:amino acid ABC transporter permease n=1 Tax=Enterococcus sp. OL5 TaxID=2590214 RepID=UPI00112DC2B9|nr:amino acid ABC transporter permease [Enterococcus sp. OL5]TPR55117.1 amino acid ABC transporter permease [Enterococcus sp. OL5]
MNFSLSYMLEVLPAILKFVPVTIVLSVISMFFAILIGLLVAFMKRSSVSVLATGASLYVSLFRGMPTLVQLFIIYYGLPQLFPAMSNLEASQAAIIGLSLKESSYLAEIFRAALESVDKGQLEAGLSVGMKKGAIYKRIILPQAAINALPATGNTFISLIKESSLAFTLGITELFAEGKMIAASSLRFFETYLVVGLVYWGLILIYSFFQRQLETKLNVPYRR